MPNSGGVYFVPGKICDPYLQITTIREVVRRFEEVRILLIKQLAII